MLKLASVLSLAGASAAQSIWDVVVSQESLSTLETVLTQDDFFSPLVTILNTTSGITALAPSNTAWDNFVAADCTVEANFQTCYDVITYHVLNSAVDFSNTVGTNRYETYDSTAQLPNDGTQSLFVSVTSDPATTTISWGVDGSSTVTTANVAADNGFANIIDTVLFPAPKAVSATAVDAGLDSLVAALTSADLVSTVDDLSGATVFAPTQAAFAAIETETYRLTASELSSVLTTHVISPSVVYSDLLPATAAALSGETLTADDVTLTVSVTNSNSANIVGADVLTNNGVVHLVDSVLLPSDLDLPSTLTILENVNRVPELSTLYTVLAGSDEYAAVVSTLDSGADNSLTLFAPTNAAFTAFADATGIDCAGGDASDKAACLATFWNHAVTSYVPAGDIPSGTTFVQSAATAASTDGMVNLGEEGQRLTVVNDDGVSVNGNQVSRADVMCQNGVIHVVDGVLTLPGSVSATASAVDTLSTLVTVLGNTDLVETVDTTASITVFAPTNDAFTELSEGSDSVFFDACTSEDPDLLDECSGVLTYHVVPGVAYSSDLETGSLTTLQGELVNVTVGEGVVLTDAAGNEANVVLADVSVANGVVHVIDSVLLLESAASVAQVTVASVAAVAMASAILA